MFDINDTNSKTNCINSGALLSTSTLLVILNNHFKSIPVVEKFNFVLTFVFVSLEGWCCCFKLQLLRNFATKETSPGQKKKAHDNIAPPAPHSRSWLGNYC